MANGKHGDHPFMDMTAYGEHPFPPDIEHRIRKLWSLGESLLHLEVQAFDWQAGLNIDEARATLDALLLKHGVDPTTVDGEPQ